MEMAEAGDYQGHKRAIVISISQYDKLAPLDFCEKDGSEAVVINPNTTTVYTNDIGSNSLWL